MDNFLLFMFAYFIGVGLSAIIFRPMRNWQDGYSTAKEHYGDWSRGFNEGYTAASKIFKDYSQGFGDGFEAGWDSALTQEGDKTCGEVDT